MDINKCLLKSIEDSMYFNGVSLELSSDFKEDYFNIPEEVEKETIRTYIGADYLNSNMFLYTIANMLKNNEITIQFNKNAIEKNINYLEKLSKNL